MMDEIAVKYLAFKVMKNVAGSGLKAGRYLYHNGQRNELIDWAAREMGIEVTQDDRDLIEQEVKDAWQRILDLDNKKQGAISTMMQTHEG